MEQKQILSEIAITGKIPEIDGKLQFMEGLKKYFTEYYGKEFQESVQESLISLCEYYPDTQNTPTFQFRTAMRHFHMKESIINLNANFGKIESNITSPMLLFIATKHVGIPIQRYLVEFVQKGGILCVFGAFPSQGDSQKPCSILKDEFLSTLPQKMPSSHPKHYRKIGCPQIGKCGKGFILHWLNNPIFKRNGLNHLINTTLNKITKKGNPKLPTLQRSTVLTINILFRFLQMQGITRKLEASLRTDYIFRHRIETAIYLHPVQDIFHIFLFNLDPKVKLPVSLHLFHPKRNISVRIRTKILGNTALLTRIEDGIPTAISYTGIHHRSLEPLYLKINSTIINTDSPINLVVIKNSLNVEIFTGEDRLENGTTLSGFTPNLINLKQSKNT